MSITVKNPSSGTKIEQGDYALIMASGASKNKLEETFGVEEGEVQVGE